jgi:hypothetical protein
MTTLGSMVCGYCKRFHRSSELCTCEGAVNARQKWFENAIKRVTGRKNMTKVVKRVIQEEYELKLNREALISLLANEDVTDATYVPNDAEIFVQIPGGGDYSGEPLAITERCPIILRWKVRKEEVIE